MSISTNNYINISKINYDWLIQFTAKNHIIEFEPSFDSETMSSIKEEMKQCLPQLKFDDTDASNNIVQISQKDLESAKKIASSFDFKKILINQQLTREHKYKDLSCYLFSPHTLTSNMPRFKRNGRVIHRTLQLLSNISNDEINQIKAIQSKLQTLLPTYVLEMTDKNYPQKISSLINKTISPTILDKETSDVLKKHLEQGKNNSYNDQPWIAKKDPGKILSYSIPLHTLEKLIQDLEGIKSKKRNHHQISSENL